MIAVSFAVKLHKVSTLGGFECPGQNERDSNEEQGALQQQAREDRAGQGFQAANEAGYAGDNRMFLWVHWSHRASRSHVGCTVRFVGSVSYMKMATSNPLRHMMPAANQKPARSPKASATSPIAKAPNA